MNSFERVLDRVASVTGQLPRGSGSKRMAVCPAHDDSSPSLSVSAGDGKVALHCFGNCETRDVLAALELSFADLFDEPVGDHPYDLAVEYVYTDEGGRTLFVVERRPGKRFRQRRPDNHGGWIHNLHDTRRVLYRLPAVLAAAAAGGTVYVVEGEKDVHSAELQGAVATCNPGGAGKWRPEYTTALAGATVIVVADRDQAGRAHAATVVTSLEGSDVAVSAVEPTAGKDLTDHLAAGQTLEQLVPVTPAVGVTNPVGHRSVTLTRASEIAVRPVRWLWSGRVALGSLALLGGREGIGKSTVAYTLAAAITRGLLDGTFSGTPRAVIVAATEDSWSHTIVPRLMAAGADLDLVYRVDAVTSLGVDTGLSLPRDLDALQQSVIEVQAALILLDPLMSRLDVTLDSHKDAEVRLALEPLVRLADATQAAVLGLIHVNKSQSTDPLTVLMGSRAFAAVARAVLFVMTDPDDEEKRLLGQPKNNLGRADLPTLTFRIESAHVADTPEGEVFTGKLTWLGEIATSIRDALQSAGEASEVRSAVSEAAAWLLDYLNSVGGVADSATIKAEGKVAGHSADAL